MFDFFLSLHWIVFATILGVGAAGYGIGLRFVSPNTNPYFFSAVFSFIACGFYASAVGVAKYLGFNLYMHPEGALKAVIAGLCFVAVDLSIIFMFRAKAPIGASMSTIRIGVALATALIGCLVFQETLTIFKYAGIAFGCLAIYFLSRKNV